MGIDGIVEMGMGKSCCCTFGVACVDVSASVSVAVATGAGVGVGVGGREWVRGGDMEMGIGSGSTSNHVLSQVELHVQMAVGITGA